MSIDECLLDVVDSEELVVLVARQVGPLESSQSLVRISMVLSDSAASEVR